MKKKKWQRGRKRDFDEKATHVKPVVAGDDPNRTHIQLDSSTDGHWVDVPKGYVLAPGTYVDAEGVLRAESDGSCVMWHYKDKNFRCFKTGTLAHEIVYLDGAPWCPECVDKEIQRRQVLVLEQLFEQQAKENREKL